MIMMSKMERFQRWRGNKSSAEQSFLNSALLFSDFVDSIETLELLKIATETKFKDFDQYNGRTWGAVIFSKFLIDEAIELLPEGIEPEKSLLMHSSAILSGLYENSGNEIKKDVFILVANLEKFFALDEIRFTTKKHYKTFLFSCYLMFLIVRLTLDSLDWPSQIIVSLVVNVGQVKQQINRFLQKIEEKIERLEEIVQQDDEEPQSSLGPIEQRLSQRYLKVLISITTKDEEPNKIKNSCAPQFYTRRVQHEGNKLLKRSIFVSLAELEVDIDKVSSCISSVIALKKKKTRIEEKIQAIKALLAATVANDQKITGRKSFLDFIESRADLYQILIENIEEKQKVEFIEKINQLKAAAESSNFSSEIMNGVRWIASPLSLVYRTATPQVMQDMITATLPTLESICKDKLKELAKASLLALDEQLKKKEQQITAITNHTFYEDTELGQLIAHEHSEQLIILQKANDTIKDAVQASCKLLATVKEKTDFLHELKENREILNEFIRLHDNFIVKISNFLARFFSCFRTNTAKMLDEASNLKKQVDGLANKYQHAVDEEMHQIESHPNLDKNFKIHLKKQFNAEENKINQERKNHIIPNRHNVRLLMHHLSGLFVKNQEPVTEQSISQSGMVST